MSTPTITTNRLHFEDLEPRRFEELGYQLLSRLYKWDRLDHTGVCGNDGGVDIYGVTIDGIHSYCQVKRYQKLTKSDIKGIYSTILSNNPNGIEPNAKFILICGCDLNKQVLDVAYEEGRKSGFEKIELYSRTRLESLLYNGHRTLLRTFFGIGNRKSESNASKIRKQARAKKYVESKLIRKSLDKIPIETLAANPDLKFITDEFMLLSAKASLSSDRYNEQVTFGRAWPIDLRDEGIELKLPFFQKIIFNIFNNTWREITEDSYKCSENEFELRSQAVGLLPFVQVVEIEEEGDCYCNCPILHCEADELIDAFSKITSIYYPLGIVFDETKELTTDEIRLIKTHIKTNLKRPPLYGKS